jgi:hypothetical protein
MIVAVLATVGTGAGILYVAEAVADADIAREVKRLRALGYAVSVAEYEARQEADPALDASQLYQEANKIMSERVDLHLFGGNWLDDLTPSEVEAFVRASDRAYELLSRASTLPYCTQGKPWDSGRGLRVPFPLQTLLRPCFVHALWKSEQGDWRGALADLSMGRRIATHMLQRDGSGNSYAAHAEVDSIRVFALMLSRHYRNPEFLSAARAWFDALPPPPLRHQFYEDDLIFKRYLLQHPTYMRDAGQFPAKNSYERWLGRLAMGTTLGRKQVEARFLRLMRERLDPVPKDNWEDHRRQAIMMERLDSEPSLVGRIAGDFMNDYWWMERTPNTAAWTTRRMADVALWILEQAHTTGKLPNRLPDEPRFIDPWTQETYRLIKSGTGFTIRSIGPNNRDDGGPMTETRVNSDDEELVIPPLSR